MVCDKDLCRSKDETQKNRFLKLQCFVVVGLQVAADSASSTSTYSLPSQHGPSRTLTAKKAVKLISKGIQAGQCVLNAYCFLLSWKNIYQERPVTHGAHYFLNCRHDESLRACCVSSVRNSRRQPKCEIKLTLKGPNHSKLATIFKPTKTQIDGFSPLL